jgi:ribosomal protein L30
MFGIQTLQRLKLIGCRLVSTGHLEKSDQLKQEMNKVFRFGRRNPRWEAKHLPAVERPSASSGSVQKQDLPFKYYKITLKRGLIGIPKRVRDVAKTLGLNKREQSVFVPVTANSAGKILRVKELVSVENVKELPEDVGKRRPYPTGYRLVGSMLVPPTSR